MHSKSTIKAEYEKEHTTYNVRLQNCLILWDQFQFIKSIAIPKMFTFYIIRKSILITEVRVCHYSKKISTITERH